MRLHVESLREGNRNRIPRLQDLLTAGPRWLSHPRRLPWLRYVPSLPRWFRRRTAPPRRPWEHVGPPRVTAELRGHPGIVCDEEQATRAFAASPLQHFSILHIEAVQWLFRHMWQSVLPTAPRMMRFLFRARAVSNSPLPVPAPEEVDSHELTQFVKETAREVGLSAVGVAPYDERYTVAQRLGHEVGDRVVVCILEQNYEATQTAPSARAERGALHTYATLMERAATLASRLKDRGYRCRVSEPDGGHINIHYAVEAGLGQLGLNGQLLTRSAGSRCRILLIETDAPLVPDGPKDFGVEKLCDNCRICVERCPSGAIPAQRAPHRGVLKAKINTARCLPVVSQAHGCAVCMKVCPVQAYGLDAVLAEFERTGRIKGKGTTELEGYVWPMDGRRYGAGEKPRLAPSFFEPEGYFFDPDRTVPPQDLKSIFT